MRSLATALIVLLPAATALAQRSSSSGASRSGGSHFGSTTRSGPANSGFNNGSRFGGRPGSIAGHGGYGGGFSRSAIIVPYIYPTFGYGGLGYGGFGYSGYGFGYENPSSVGYNYYPQSTPSMEYGAAQGQPAPPPVIINQTFINGASGSGDGAPVDNNPRMYQAPSATPQDWAMSEGRYYLIAYKDHSVYTALAYWMEGGALHYVTPQNAHNQVTLDLLDTDLTKKLNADRGLAFNIAR